MADRILLEGSGVDGIQLEDASGVVLLESGLALLPDPATSVPPSVAQGTREIRARTARSGVSVANPGAFLHGSPSAFVSGMARFRARTILAPVAPQIHPALAVGSLPVQTEAEVPPPVRRPLRPRGGAETPVPGLPPAWVGFDAARVPWAPRRVPPQETTAIPVPRLQMGWLGEDAVRVPRAAGTVPSREDGAAAPYPLLGALGLLPDVSEGRPRLCPRSVPRATADRLLVVDLGPLADVALPPPAPRPRTVLGTVDWPAVALAAGPALALLPDVTFWARLFPDRRPLDLSVSADPLDLRSHPAQTGIARFLARTVLAPVSSGQALPAVVASAFFTHVDGVQAYLRPRLRVLPGETFRGDPIRLTPLPLPDFGLPPALGRRPVRPRFDLSIWPLRAYAAPGLAVLVLGEPEYARRAPLRRPRGDSFRPAAPLTVALTAFVDLGTLPRRRPTLRPWGLYSLSSLPGWPLVVPAVFHPGPGWQFLAGDTVFSFDDPAGTRWQAAADATAWEAPYTTLVWCFPPGRTTWEF